MGIRKQELAPYQYEAYDDDNGAIIGCYHAEETAKTKHSEYLGRKARPAAKSDHETEQVKEVKIDLPK